MKLCSKDICVGCGACSIVCPTASIKMCRNGYLHDYPMINSDTCVECGKCTRICPSLTFTQTRERIPVYYCCWNKDNSVRSNSTSGGIAASLASKAINLGYYVCGAQYDESFNVSHRIASSIDGISSFAGSKYVQSYTVQAFKDIISLLDKGAKVLFFGTPCQAEALRRLVRDNERNNLFTCEIICHGVNSPRVWEDYVSYLESINKSSLCSFNFRSKVNGWQKKSGGVNLQISYKTVSGKNVSMPYWKNEFTLWFAKHYILRPSCLSCSYRTDYRKSDITIGDFWGIQNIIPTIRREETFRGVSVAIVSTDKGQELFSMCDNIHFEEVPEVDAKKVLQGFLEKKTLEQRHSEIQRMRSFEKEYLDKGIEYMLRAYPPISYWQRIKDGVRSKFHLK